jgi:hypothetical protein
MRAHAAELGDYEVGIVVPPVRIGGVPDGFDRAGTPPPLF